MTWEQGGLTRASLHASAMYSQRSTAVTWRAPALSAHHRMQACQAHIKCSALQPHPPCVCMHVHGFQTKDSMPWPLTPMARLARGCLLWELHRACIPEGPASRMQSVTFCSVIHSNDVPLPHSADRHVRATTRGAPAPHPRLSTRASLSSDSIWVTAAVMALLKAAWRAASSRTAKCRPGILMSDCTVT